MSIFNISESLIEADESLVCLKRTKKIKSEDLKYPEWADLKRQYKTVTDPRGQAIISIINAILCQNRLIFVLPRDKARPLIVDDLNRDKKIRVGLDNEKWPELLRACYRVGLFKMIKQGIGRSLAIYEVIHPELLKIIQVNVEIQRQEAFDFVKNKSAKGSIADQCSDDSSDQCTDVDLVLSNKNKKSESESVGFSDSDLNLKRGITEGIKDSDITASPSVIGVRRNSEQIARLEKMINLAGVEDATKEMFSRWRKFLVDRPELFLSSAKEVILLRDENALTFTQKKDLQSDSELLWCEASEHVFELIQTSETRDPVALEATYKQTFGMETFNLLVSRNSFREILGFYGVL